MGTKEERAKLIARVEEIMEDNLYNPAGDGWTVGGISGTAELIVDALLSLGEKCPGCGFAHQRGTECESGALEDDGERSASIGSAFRSLLPAGLILTP